MKLETILNKELKKNPEKYDDETIDRVTTVVRHVDENPGRYIPYRHLKELSDFQLYYQIHPKWHGKNTCEMQKDDTGIKAFYSAFNKWVNNKAKNDKKYKKQLIKSVFPNIKEGWKVFDTIKDWKDYFKMNPQWQGKNTSEMYRDETLKGDRYYVAFRDWAFHEAKGDKNRQKDIMRKVFTSLRPHWAGYNTIEDWAKHYDAHPEFHKMPSEMTPKIQKEWNRFYQSFHNWVRKESAGDDEYAKALTIIVMHDRS
ncbi:MAG: hypothetical protein ACP5NW_02810 [Candidatus Woesearchaeota archaeon]